jgi:hypothetical protein
VRLSFQASRDATDSPRRGSSECGRRYRFSVHTLSEIEAAIRASWGPDTISEGGEGWTPENPALGQCDVTALLLHDIFGGEVLAAGVFRDSQWVMNHMWNRLPGGLEVDLTREQFKDGEVLGETSVRQRPAQFEPDHPRYHRYVAYRVLADRVWSRLGTS